MFNFSNLMHHAIALQRGPRSCLGHIFFIIFFLCCVFLHVCLSLSLCCLLVFARGVNAYYYFLCIATISLHGTVTIPLCNYCYMLRVLAFSH